MYVCKCVYMYVYVCMYVCMYMYINIYEYIYIYIYIYRYIYWNLSPTIEIVNGQTECTNWSTWKYLFHIVVKSLTRILYRSMSSGDISSNEKNVYI